MSSAFAPARLSVAATAAPGVAYRGPPAGVTRGDVGREDPRHTINLGRGPVPRTPLPGSDNDHYRPLDGEPDYMLLFFSTLNGR